eukprot:5557013-Amphidinium_carterae.1
MRADTSVSLSGGPEAGGAAVGLEGQKVLQKRSVSPNGRWPFCSCELFSRPVKAFLVCSRSYFA